MDSAATGRPHRPWYARVGPGLITACVVIGPGSILTSSRVGATYGYGMSWVVATAVIFMTVYMTLGARIGVVSGRTATELLVERAGRWLAVLVGVSVFFIASSFQFGNNLGVHSAFQIYFDFDYIVVVFNALSIAFLFAARHLYRTLERLMMLFVGLMLLSFVANLVFSRPEPLAIARGFIPKLGDAADLSLLGLVGTTFIAAAAYYQSHLVRQKGWGRAELRDGLLDARVGSAIMALITLMIMWTAASVLESRELGSVADVARQLEPLFGQTGQALFCLGLFAAAYSSFLVNSMVGGFVLSSALGLGSQPGDEPRRGGGIPGAAGDGGIHRRRKGVACRAGMARSFVKGRFRLAEPAQPGISGEQRKRSAHCPLPRAATSRAALTVRFRLNRPGLRLASRPRPDAIIVAVNEPAGYALRPGDFVPSLCC